MAVIALVVFVGFVGAFAFSQPKSGKSFSPGRKKFNQACIYTLLGAIALSAIYMIYNATFGVKCDDYQIDTDVYAIELKTDGHRMLGFMEEIKSQTLYGEDAVKLMEAAFGDTTDASMEEWNSLPSWAGKYSAKVYYTERAYQRAKDGLAPEEITRNSLTDGRIFRFNICENGKVYCDVGLPKRPVYRISLPGSIKRQLFPW